MTVYVDSAKIPARVGRMTSRWSHLTADTQSELHDFAERLGLKREWFQTCKARCGPVGKPCVHWHYDVTAGKRVEAIRLGAVEIDMRQMSALITDRRRSQ